MMGENKVLFEVTDVDELLNVEEFVGQKTTDVLHEAFGSRRGTHSKVDDYPITPEDYQKTWQEQIEKQGSDVGRSAYIHIPFCRLRCLYCGFFKNFQDSSRQKSYVNSLLKDIQMSGKAAYCHSSPLKAVYFGGGTPGVLTPTEIKTILSALKENLNLAKDCEITFETSVCDLDDDQFAACLDGGVNRFSLGVQTFDTKIRQSLGRPDNEERLRTRLQELTTKQQQAAIVIDLIYGLPGQTREQWQYDLDVAIDSKIHGLDTYSLNVIPRTILAQKIAEGSMPPVATRSEQADFFVQAIETLSKKGLRRLSVCHWGRFDLKERNMYNKLGKGANGRIPFGAGAGGNIDGFRLRLEPDVDLYEQMIAKGLKPVAFMARRPEHYNLFNQIRESMDQGHLILDGIDANIKEMLLPLLAAWEQKGFINSARGTLELTLAGQFWYVELTQALIDFLQILQIKLPSSQEL